MEADSRLTENVRVVVINNYHASSMIPEYHVFFRDGQDYALRFMPWQFNYHSLVRVAP